MVFCNSGSEPLFLDQMTTWCHGPSKKHNVQFINIGPHPIEPQDDSSDSELCMASTGEPACGTWSTKRKSRPCKGKRLRYKKFIDRLRDMVMNAPNLMDIQSVDWPPSLQNDYQKQLKLMMHLTELKLQQLKIQGEPCTLNPAPNGVVVFRLTL